MNPRQSRAKGRLAVGEVRRMALDACPDLHPDDILIPAGSATGEDLHLSPLARKRLPFRIEVKFCQRLNVPAALRQAFSHVPEGSTDIPLLVFRKNHGRFYVALLATDFFRIAAENTRPTTERDDIPHVTQTSKIEAEK